MAAVEAAAAAAAGVPAKPRQEYTGEAMESMTMTELVKVAQGKGLDTKKAKKKADVAYFEGAAPENGYQPRMPYTLNVLSDPRPQDIEPGYMRVFLKTAGADSPRPMKLRQKASTGQWFLWEYSSILSGIRIPAAQDPWA